MFLADPVSEGESIEVGHSSEWVCDHFYLSFLKVVIVHKGVGQMTALDELLTGNVDVDELIVGYLSHVEEGAVHYD